MPSIKSRKYKRYSKNNKRSKNRRLKKQRGGAPNNNGPPNHSGPLSEDEKNTYLATDFQLKNAEEVRFSAKLAAFILQGQDLGKINGNAQTGFDETDDNKAVFGVLPFLHLDITEGQFKEMLSDASNKMIETLSSICNGQQLEDKLKTVDFNCGNQSDAGINMGLTTAIIDSINNRWNIRDNGKKVLQEIFKIQVEQASLMSTKEGLRDRVIIPRQSLNYSLPPGAN